MKDCLPRKGKSLSNVCITIGNNKHQVFDKTNSHMQNKTLIGKLVFVSKEHYIVWCDPTCIKTPTLHIIYLIIRTYTGLWLHNPLTIRVLNKSISDVSNWKPERILLFGTKLKKLKILADFYKVAFNLKPFWVTSVSGMLAMIISLILTNKANRFWSLN